MNITKLFARLQYVPISAAERKQLKEAQAICDQFEADAAQCDPGAGKREISRLRAEYHANPMDKNAFAKLEAAELGRPTLELHYQNVRLSVRTARGKWSVEKVVPLVLPIL